MKSCRGAVRRAAQRELSKIDSLTQQLADMTAEYAAKESEMDALRDDLCGKKVLISNYSKEIATKTQLKSPAIAEKKYALQLAAVPEVKRRRNFKVAAIAIWSAFTSRSQHGREVLQHPDKKAPGAGARGHRHRPAGEEVVVLQDDIGSLESSNLEVATERDGRMMSSGHHQLGTLVETLHHVRWG